MNSHSAVKDNFDEQGKDDGRTRPAIRIGVSACLLGANVRFDGGHKRDRFLTDSLAAFFEFVPFCPEVAIGMGTPRQPIRLVGDASHPRAVGVKTPGLDVTLPLARYGQSVAEKISNMSGFIFKKDSPSCGMERVRVYSEKGMPQRSGTGIFASEIMRANPLLPVEEEGRLKDLVLRENFVTRVLVYARWQSFMQQGLGKSGLLSFHASHKLLVLAHSTTVYRELGRMLANLGKVDLPVLANRYIAMLMGVLKIPATRKRHANVLQHLLGYLKKGLGRVQREDLVETIDAYRRGDYPLVVPVRMLQHHFRDHPHPYVSRQVYLHPYPQALGLRNGI